MEDVKRMVTFAQQRGCPFTIRLVKGAYWDYETVVAEQKHWPIPVYTNKQETDANFEACARYLLDHQHSIKLAIGSHNVRSIVATTEYAKSLGLPKNALEIQMLYGMADPIKAAMIAEGYRLREYATVGEMIPGMAYLVRRLLENTSNESFLRSRFEQSVSPDVLLRDPAENLSRSSATFSTREFQNHPLLDFGHAENRNMFERALKYCQKRSEQEHLLVINGKRVKTGNTLHSVNPSHPTRVVGTVHLAGQAEAEQAVQAAAHAFTSWRKVPAVSRAQVLDCAADIMDRDRFNLAARQVDEVGKTWAEADADVCEAIDFCRYYAKEMRRLAEPMRVGRVQGEHNEYSYEPRGVTVVIAPWNFPLAILAGMVSAAIVTGNTVVMKPAEQSMVIASEFMEILEEAGVPPGVVNFLPGLGEDVGRYLVRHKDVATICFTGSKDVGVEILQAANTLVPGQQQIKRCITEMGGKNALIIDSDADPDEAIPAITYSAFGFSGQKCSALSRLIILESMYDTLVARLLERMQSLKVRFAEDPEAYCGPVIDFQAQKKIMSMIEAAKAESTLAFQGTVPEEGYFVPMTIFTEVDRSSSIAREEVFGPVLAIIKAKDLDEALAIANDSEYALTGGVFSRSPATIERCKEAFKVGNLYINRGITGAMVERNPFGGFKLSGVGSKTGGPDYLKQFMEPRVHSENTLRRGFAPSEEN
jgi:RHH-type proline utilization regulon transcriptional repressor/proline dehydrogenase/delta 1-pyrroline-5-carboxylate dehydrogenase